MALSVLLAGAPAWQHSHPLEHHAHRHAHDHDHGVTGEPHPHRHVALLGVELTLPAEPDDDHSQEDQPAYLVAAPSLANVGQPPAHFAALAQPICQHDEPLQVVPPFRCKVALAAPLCDTARHERSGVQLI
jgi:hypothetical protein